MAARTAASTDNVWICVWNSCNMLWMVSRLENGYRSKIYSPCKFLLLSGSGISKRTMDFGDEAMWTTHMTWPRLALIAVFLTHFVVFRLQLTSIQKGSLKRMSIGNKTFTIGWWRLDGWNEREHKRWLLHFTDLGWTPKKLNLCNNVCGVFINSYLQSDKGLNLQCPGISLRSKCCLFILAAVYGLPASLCKSMVLLWCKYIHQDMVFWSVCLFYVPEVNPSGGQQVLQGNALCNQRSSRFWRMLNLSIYQLLSSSFLRLQGIWCTQAEQYLATYFPGGWKHNGPAPQLLQLMLHVMEEYFLSVSPLSIPSTTYSFISHSDLQTWVGNNATLQDK